MDYTKQIFELLGVKPEEEFQLRMDSDYDFLYKLDEKLNIWSYYKTLRKWAKLEDSSNSILTMILTGEAQIVKIPHPTAEEQIALDYARVCGRKWIARDKNGDIFAYIGKPEKYHANWRNPKDPNDWIKIDYSISFICWEDEEPFYLMD